MSDETRPARLSGLEESLAALRPTPAGIDRDQLMYEAGRKAGTRRGWYWPAATAALLLTTIVLSGVLFFRPVPERLVPVVIHDLPTAPEGFSPTVQDPIPPPDRGAVASYFRLRDEVAEHGLDGLPRPAPAPELKTQPFDHLYPLPRGL
jgi:hypothetical protein